MKRVPLFLALASGITLTGTSPAAMPTVEELWALVQQQQATIEELERRLLETERRTREQAEQIEATADVVEEVAGEPAAVSRTRVGGYGELHYNNLSNDGTGADKEEADFHRFILYLGHEFNESIRFFSELEIEHALVGDGGPGAVELEQAYIEMDLGREHRLRAGLDILPIGFINPTHEPNTFYGVERNPVESEIIPTTWWEAVLGANGELARGWAYNLVLHSGLSVDTTGGSAWRIRSGRGKVAQAEAGDGAVTATLAWRGMPGLEIGAAVQYQSDITQGKFTESIPAWLFEGHLDYRYRGFGLRALYARWELEEGPAGTGPKAISADRQAGWYLEPSYRFALPGGLVPGELGVFGRYSVYDARNEQAVLRYVTYAQSNVGLNWWPHPGVVFKFDYQWQEVDDLVKKSYDGFNLGLGYQFY